jgi:hypothetical protein
MMDGGRGGPKEGSVVSRITAGSRRLVVIGAVVLAAVLLVAGARNTSAAPEKAAPQATCVLTNPAYSGKCTQTTPLLQGATPAQACQAVLDCLNNANCLKTYCDATTVRTGWKLESAK